MTTSTVTTIQRRLIYGCSMMLVFMVVGIAAIFFSQLNQGSVLDRVDQSIQLQGVQNETATCRADILADANIAIAKGIETFLVGLRDGFEDGELSPELLSNINFRILEQREVIEDYENLPERCPPPEEPES